LIVHVLKFNGRAAEIGGNFGEPILGLPTFADSRTYVIEFSSFQIDLTPTLTPDVACLLNITPDHLDRHGTIENYASVKEKVFSGLTSAGTAVISLDDRYCRAIAGRLGPGFEVKQISRSMDVENGIKFESAQLAEIVNGTTAARIDLTGIFSLRGAHNWENAAAATAICRSLGLSIDEIQSGLRSFPGLAHRMEEVGRKGRILFVNDSKATNSDAAAKALASFKEIYWIAGGRAKQGGIKELESFHANIRKAYLIGECATVFAGELDGHLDYEITGTLDKAVAAATRDAEQSEGVEPVVLLSPACASHDQYPSFVVRGEVFREAVRAQQGVVMKKIGDAV
jgi:UDP-N-acetylmuramoylalanine--D-glutamate ligase